MSTSKTGSVRTWRSSGASSASRRSASESLPGRVCATSTQSGGGPAEVATRPAGRPLARRLVRQVDLTAALYARLVERGDAEWGAPLPQCSQT